MNRADLIAALQDECRTDQMKVEDFLEALSDLCIDALQKGRRVSLGFGWIFAAPRKERGKTCAVIHFKASPELRKALGMTEIKFPAAECIDGDTCPTCGFNKVQRSKECSTCLYRRWMKKNGHVVKPRESRETRAKKNAAQAA